MYSVTKYKSVPTISRSTLELRHRCANKAWPTAWEENAADLEWNSDRPLERATRRYACAHERASTCRSHEDPSYQLAKCATKATSCSAEFVERSSTTSAGGVFRLRADTSAKKTSGTAGAKMLMGFEQDTKFATDDTFLGEDGTPITILAGYDGLTKAFFANVVLCKGMCHGDAERTFAHNVLSTGHQKVILQSGQEPSIMDVKHKSRHAHPNRNRLRSEPSRRLQLQRQHRVSQPNHPGTDPCNQGLHRTTDRRDLKWLV